MICPEILHAFPFKVLMITSTYGRKIWTEKNEFIFTVLKTLSGIGKLSPHVVVRYITFGYFPQE